MNRAKPRARRWDTTGSSSVFATLVGGTMILGAFAATTQFTVETVTRFPVEQATHFEATSQAASLISLMMLRGSEWFGPDACSPNGVLDMAKFQPDGVARLGLGEENCGELAGRENLLNYDKIRALKNASLDQSLPNNGKVDFPEARRSLGLAGTGTEFHFTVEPILGSGDAIRPLYVADYKFWRTCLQVLASSACVEVTINSDLVEDALEDPTMGIPVPTVPPAIMNASNLANLNQTNCVVFACVKIQYEPSLQAQYEAAYLSKVAPQFVPNVMDPDWDHPNLPYQSGGDVIPDYKGFLQNFLPSKLKENGVASTKYYNVIVVGTNISSSDLSGNFRQDILDWVRAGGTLIHFGNANNVNWLESDAGVKLKKNHWGNQTAPDPADPLLNQPWELFWEVYDNKTTAWELNSNGHAWHRRVLSDLWSTDHGYLLHSKDGAFGKGRILATAYQPWNLTIDPLKMCSDWRVSQDTSWCWRGGNATPNDSTDDFSRFQRKGGKSYEFKADACHPMVATEESCEAVKFIRNLVTMAGDDLMVDYGAPIPTTMAVGSARRLALVNSPALGGMVTVRLQLHVWGTSIVRAPTPEPAVCVDQFPYWINRSLGLGQGEWSDTFQPGSCNANHRLKLTLQLQPEALNGSWTVRSNVTYPPNGPSPGYYNQCLDWTETSSDPCITPSAPAGRWQIKVTISPAAAPPFLGGTYHIKVEKQSP